MTSTPFEHSPLDPANPRAFQVLELLPSLDLKGPIHCLLQHCSLDEDIQYEALSYAWGDPGPGHTVLINGSHPLNVTPNCLEALVHLRRRFRRRTLWIDAICIDQREADTSKQERDRQIRIMGEIYSKAQKVIVWLGPAEPSSKRTINRLKILARIDVAKRSNLGYSAPNALGRLLSNRMADPYTNPPTLRPRYQAFESMLQSPWWQRIWTLQEQVLARQCDIYHGRQTISFSDFLIAQRSTLYGDRVNEGYRLTHEARYFLSSYRKIVALYARAHFSVSRKVRDTMAWQLLEAALLLEAQLPIDKIYGLYSLLTAYCALPLPVPDYNKTAEDVYEETAWAWITSRRDLSILKLAARAGHADNLPSWVPAWNQGGSEFLRPLISSHFDWVDSEDSGASGSGMLATIPREAEEPTPVARMLAPGKLHVLDARYAGRVNHAIGPDTSFEQYRLSHEAVHVHLGWCRLVHNVFARSASKYEEALNEMFRSLIYPGIPGFDPEYNGDLQQRRKSFQQWFDFMLYINRSSCSGSSVTAATPDVRASRASALDLYHKILGGIDVEHLKEDLAQHHVGNVEGREGLAQFVEDVKSTKMKLYSVRNHSLCLLDNDNTMAVTNFWCQEGDEIFVFPGTDCPFVLRGAPDGGGYRLVGPALVDRLYRIGYQKWRSEGTDLQDIVLI